MKTNRLLERVAPDVIDQSEVKRDQRQDPAFCTRL
jgi:hypothetical protein